MAVPTRWGAFVFRGKAAALQLRRAARDLADGSRRFPKTERSTLDVLLAESETELWTSDPANPAEQALTAGKVHNLRIAARHLDGIVIPAGQTFSFWRQVGRATRRHGFAAGRELREGCVVPAVGGGLCQLSNALYDASLRAGMEIVERHRHSITVHGSLAEVNRDATIFWNYVDFRFRFQRDIRLDVLLTDRTLIVRYWSNESAPKAAAPQVIAHDPATEASGECAICGQDYCFRKNDLPTGSQTFGRTAFLVDGYWPEYDAYIGSIARDGDVLCLPLDGTRLGRAAYRWSTQPFAFVYEQRFATGMRAFRMRFAAGNGASRQRLFLREADRLAERFAAGLSPDVTHVVVMQHLLPALWEGGHLGGRTFDVLMMGVPMADLQRTLDDACLLHPESTTLNDFRADPRLVEVESQALARAERCITPHSYVRARTGERSIALPWRQPRTERLASVARNRTIVFPAATLGRKGAYEVRAAARALDLHVLAPGPQFEAPDFWRDTAFERWSSYADALIGARAVVLPAFVEQQPRLLLAALAAGVPVIASPNCGLHDVAGIIEVPAGDAAALKDAIERIPFS